MAQQKTNKVRVGEAVHFLYRNLRLRGVVARLAGSTVFVLGDDRQSYRLPLDSLNPSPTLPDPAGPTQGAAAKAQLLSPHNLDPGERVAFVCRGRRLTGTIVRLNPRRAHVLCDSDAEYAVPYARIERLTKGDGGDSGAVLATVRKLAEDLLAEHGLKGWCFAFDHATRRAGCCDYRRKRISLAMQFARRASEDEIRDTLLHEIAHALVGRRHHHDAVWRAKALAIGGSGERCHDLTFSPPRYIVACRNGCWRATAERRRRNVVCRECRGEIVYQTYTEERWETGELATDGEQG